MSLTADIIRGHTDTIILAQLVQRDSYGYEINKRIQLLTRNAYELKEATLYTAFRRLEKQNYIQSYWGDEETGARRRYYRLTPAGRVCYEQLVREWNEAKVLIDQMVMGS